MHQHSRIIEFGLLALAGLPHLYGAVHEARRREIGSSFLAGGILTGMFATMLQEGRHQKELLRALDEISEHIAGRGLSGIEADKKRY